MQRLILLAGLGVSVAVAGCSLILGDKDYINLDVTGAGGATATGGGAEATSSGSTAATTGEGSSTGTCGSGQSGCGGAASTTASSTGASAASSTAASTTGSTAASSSSTGSGGEVPCGPGGPLTDSFTGNTLDPTKWGPYTDGKGSSVSQNNQVAIFVTGADGSNAGVYSQNRFSLSGCSASIKSVDAPKLVGVTVYYLLSSQMADADQVAFTQSGNYLNLEVKITGGIKVSHQIVFNKSTHVYWRFRATPAAGGTVYWETSPTGATWDEQFSYPVADLGFPIDKVQVNFGTSTNTVSMGTTVHFDSFNLIP